MTFEDYVHMVVSAKSADSFSVHDEHFKTLSKEDQNRVIMKFDGYGLRDARQAYQDRLEREADERHDIEKSEPEDEIPF